MITVEVYTRSQVLHGQVSCPDNLRILDLFNGYFKKIDFIELTHFSNPAVSEPQDCHSVEYIRKTAIEFLAVSDLNTGRGCGSNPGWKGYPVVSKTPVSVILQMQSSYVLSGQIHLLLGQDTKTYLNSDIQFLPLTRVSIFRDNSLFGTRPFAIVNKDYIFSSIEEKIMAHDRPIVVAV